METQCEQTSPDHISIAEYDIIARKILLSLYGLSAIRIIKDNDKFGSIVTEVMIADWKWNKKGTIYGYRKQRVKWAISKMYAKNDSTISLFTEVGKNEILLDKVSDNKGERYISDVDINDSIKYLNNIMDACGLTQKQKYCFNEYYQQGENVSMESIGEKLGITREAVRINIKKATDKIVRCIPFDQNATRGV